MSKRRAKPPADGPVRDVPKAEAAEALGISTSRLEDYVRSGCPCDKPAQAGPGRSKMFNLDEVRAWMNAHGRTGTPGRPTNIDKLAMKTRAEGVPTGRAGAPPLEPGKDEPPHPDDSPDELVRKTALSEAKKAHFDAIKSQVQALREQGKVLDTEDVVAAWGEEGARVRQAVLAFPGRVAPKLVGLAEGPLTLELERTLRELLATLSSEEPTTKAREEVT